MSENSLAWIDSFGEPFDMTVVEVSANGSGWDFIIRAPVFNTPDDGPDITGATVKFYITQTYEGTLEDAIGSIPENVLTFDDSDTGTISDAIASLPQGTKLFITPYTTTSAIDAADPSYFIPNDASPLFKTTAKAKAATTIGASQCYTFVVEMK
jgi:hypothetical protein